MAKMAPTPMLNGTSLTCEDGSKLSLMGEDGDVSLTCLFTAPGVSERSRFSATFAWSHAQYTGCSLLERNSP